MYICNKCGNIVDFEEINVIKTHVHQDYIEKNNTTSDEFDYRENVICLNCNSTLEDGDVFECRRIL